MAKKKAEKSGMLKATLIALFIVSLLVRLYFWPAGLFHTDSVITAMEAERSVNTGQLKYLQGPLGYPGYALVTSTVWLVWSTLTGAVSSEWILILFSIVSGSIAVVIMHEMARKFTGSSRVALYSALALSFMPIHLSLSTYVKDQVFGACFMMASLMLAYDAGKKRDMKSKLIAAAVMGYTIAIRQQEFMLLPAFLLIYFLADPFIELKKNKDAVKMKVIRPIQDAIRDATILIVPSPLIFVAAFIPRWTYEPEYDLVGSFLQGGGQQVNGFSLFSPLLTIYSIPWALITLTWLGAFLLAYGIIVGFSRNKGMAAAMCAWMFPYFFILGNFSQVSPYFIYPAFIPAAFFIGWGLSDLADKFGPNTSHILMAVLVIWMLLNIMPVLEHRKAYCGPCEFSKRIGQETPEGSWVSGMDETRHYEYYAKRISPRRGRPNLGDGDDVESYLDFFESTIRGGKKIYVTTMDLQSDMMPQGVFAPHPNDQSVIVNRVTGKPYVNLRLDPASNSLYDRQTGKRAFAQGWYSIELSNRFIIRPVFTMENEDWHHRTLELDKYNSTLFEIVPR